MAPAEEALSPAEGEEALVEGVGPRESRSTYTADDITAELANPGANLGNGARAAVLWSEPAFDMAMIGLAGGGFMQETNSTTQEMVFVILQGEVEYEVHGEAQARLLRIGAEAIAPVGSTYTWRNASSTDEARISCVVPRVDD